MDIYSIYFLIYSYYKKLEKFIKNKNFLPEDEWDDLFFDIKSACLRDVYPSEFIDMLYERGFLLENEDEINEFMRLLVDLLSNIRKSKLCGHTSIELFGRNEKPLVKSSTMLFTMVNKVENNDLCICGSGLRYEDCCGRINK